MVIIKTLDTSELIDEACALLYKEYIETSRWVFSNDNPSGLNIIIKNKRKLLVDRITPYAIWLGAFDADKMVGCIRIFKATDNIPFEIEKYSTASEVFDTYIKINQPNIYEGSRACVDSEYRGNDILLILYLGILEYCQKEKAFIFGSASNGYVKSILRRIEWPCKKEEAFKFEESDPVAVNFYLASPEEINSMIQHIKALKNSRNRKALNIFDALDMVAPIFPAPMYWHDTKGVVLGINAQALKGINKPIEDILGKTPYDFYSKDIADHIWQNSMQVIKNGETLSQEEYAYDSSGKRIGTYLAIKAPLYNEHGNMLGVLGTSIDITAEKETEQLKIENEKQRTLLEEEEKFTKIANQVAHDIRSPLSSLLIIVKSCTQIPEAERIALREAATGIGDIANHLLDKYNKNKKEGIEAAENKALLVSTALIESLTAKKYQYKNLPIKFDYHFEENTPFVFIKTQFSAFKRMVSNLINNAVEALEESVGAVSLHLAADNVWVKIAIQDTGKGMPPELIDKIMNQVSVTEGKKDGYGIGLSQVWETLDKNQGEMHIDSQLGKGTTITLTFPRISEPNWITKEIFLNANDTVIILDDDSSIHGAWQTRFKTILNEKLSIKLKHFEESKEALEFINALSLTEKNNVFLLSDYELLKQELNGLHIIAKSQIKRSILVTSHYADPLVQEKATKIGTKILPKQLASEVPVKIIESEQATKKDSALNSNRVDMVIVEDNEDLLECMVNYIFNDKVVDQYIRPDDFLKNIHRYRKDTKIYLDNNYADSWLKGIDVAKELHEQGYERLYLFSADTWHKGEIPSYLTIIDKGDVDSLEKSKND